MKAAKQYFPVVLFIILFKVVSTFESLDELLKCEMKATEQYFPVVLFLFFYVKQYPRKFGLFLFRTWAI